MGGGLDGPPALCGHAGDPGPGTLLKRFKNLSTTYTRSDPLGKSGPVPGARGLWHGRGVKFGQPGDLGTPERWILVEGPIIKIGRASCRERVEIAVGGVGVENKR